MTTVDFFVKLPVVLSFLDIKKHRCQWVSWLLLWVIISALGAPTSPLPVDQAFSLRVWSPDSHTVLVQWDIQPGYYLYKDRIHLSAAADGVVQLGEPVFPSGVDHVSPILGRFTAYQGQTQISIPIVSTRATQFDLQIKYQGCSEQGFCYPPQTRLAPVFIAPIAHGLSSAAVAPTSVQQLNRQHYPWTVWLGFFGLGLLISLTPCVLPMIPVLSGLIMGKENVSHGRAFFISLAYVLGMAFTYAIVGVLFGILGGSIQAFLQKPWIIVLFSLIFIAMALSLFGVYQLEPPQKLRSWIAGLSNRQRRGSLVGAAVMGCLSTLILSPCATPPLVAVLSYISQTGNAYLGGVALFIIGLGSGAPLLLIGAFGRRLLPKAGPWMRLVENILGLMLLGVSIWMLGRILPGSVTLILWASLAIGVAVYLKTFALTVTPIQQLGKSLGILIFVYAILLLVGAAQGGSELWPPLSFATSACLPAKSGNSFISVKTVAEVSQQISRAEGKPVLLDFYADWCVSCKLIERQVFNQPRVQDSLAGFLLLRADVTANDADAQALMRQYGVVAPPTIVVFNRQHQELPQSRVVGEISPAHFLEQIKPAQSRPTVDGD